MLGTAIPAVLADLDERESSGGKLAQAEVLRKELPMGKVVVNMNLTLDGVMQR